MVENLPTSSFCCEGPESALKKAKAWDEGDQDLQVVRGCGGYELEKWDDEDLAVKFTRFMHDENSIIDNFKLFKKKGLKSNAPTIHYIHNLHPTQLTTRF